MRISSLILIIFLFSFSFDVSSQSKDLDLKVLAKQMFDSYELYKDSTITHRRFKHKDIVPIIQALPYAYEVAGKSFEGRDIYRVTVGRGNTHILLWSQMHGDEPTATMALMDMFKFFQAKNDEFDELRESILSNCTLHIIPMLNPDGAERYQRRTATEIDMNRDALRLQTVEGRLLKSLQQSIKPAFAFNLHDQGTRTSAGRSPKQATISYLATAYDVKSNWNPVRTKAMQVICSMNNILQEFIPGHIAKYSDEHEPRAFGDNIQKWGSSLILIESGGYPNDKEKQFIRKLNFVSILSGLQSISINEYLKYNRADYLSLPTNDVALFDILLRNVTFNENGKKVVKDIGINLLERNIDNATSFIVESRIDDIGDLSTSWGLNEIDATGAELSFYSTITELPENLVISEKQKNIKSIAKGTEATFVLAKESVLSHMFIDGLLHQGK